MHQHIHFFNCFRFFDKFTMPGVIGLVDGTHISIKKPDNEVECVYYAVRKAAHTKNVQVVGYLKYSYIY